MTDSGGNTTADPAEGLGRWRTLRDAARILNLSQKDILKSLKRGKMRGTQIGNNWFAYVDPEMEQAAAERARQQAEKQAARKHSLDELRAENDALRAKLKARSKKSKGRTAPAGEAKPEPSPKVPQETSSSALAPLVAQISQNQQAVQSELAFLREELRSVREQHAEEMRRKDILLRQSHDLLQEIVRTGLLRRQEEPQQIEVERLRREHQLSMRVLAEMTTLIGVVVRRIRQSDHNHT